MEKVWVVTPSEAGQRLDTFCASRSEGLSRNQVQRLNRGGDLSVDGAQRPSHYLLKAGQSVRLWVPSAEAQVEPVGEVIPLRLVYEDDQIVVINKDAGIVVHPAHGNRDGTVVNALLGRGTTLARLGAPERPGIVHRLDKDTSGLMVIAKTDQAYRSLTDQIRERSVRKTYHAIVWGNLGEVHRIVDAPISRHRLHRQRMAVSPERGREAITEVFVMDTFDHFDYIRVVTLTGRTHQIRVHLSHILHPILGDPTYGGRQKKRAPSHAMVRERVARLLKVMRRQALHASGLVFAHPADGRRLEFKSALPEDMCAALELLHARAWVRRRTPR